MKIIENKVFDRERELYEEENLHLIKCSFDGINDGESAMKEASNLLCEKCYFNLRYPFWHCKDVKINGCNFTVNCRAPLWYTNNIEISDSKMESVKALRECKNVLIRGSKTQSTELLWLCSDVKITDSEISSEYFMLNSKDISLSRVNFSGKYSFQYVENGTIDQSVLNTKDAFWHTKNMYVKNSVINGEYLGWYSENLTLENCIIKGTQPLCYCKGLNLINCQMIDCDLSFEKSYVQAEITSDILSVKNPYDGIITSPCIHNYIKDKEEYRCKVYSSGRLL